MDFRHQRCTLRRIAKAVGAPLSTVVRVMKALGLGRLQNLDPTPTLQRDQWEKSGDMVHVVTKQRARFERFGHHIIGDRRQAWSRGAGYEKVPVAIDDATRLAVAPNGALFESWQSCPMSRTASRSASWLAPWAGSASRGSPAAVSSQITAPPIAQRWLSGKMAPLPPIRRPWPMELDRWHVPEAVD